MSLNSIKPLNGQASSMDTSSIRGLLEMTQPTTPDVEHPELRLDSEGGNAIAMPATIASSVNGSATLEHRSELPSEDIRVAALKATLEKHRGERQIVLLQDFPDPDALSGAWA